MSDTKLKTRLEIIWAESLSSKFAASATLATAGATIPANCGDVIVCPDSACHWNPVGAATATFAHAIAASEPFRIPAAKVATAQIFGDAGAINLRVIYMRGAGRQDASYAAQSRPY